MFFTRAIRRFPAKLKSSARFHSTMEHNRKQDVCIRLPFIFDFTTTLSLSLSSRSRGARIPLFRDSFVCSNGRGNFHGDFPISDIKIKQDCLAALGDNPLSRSSCLLVVRGDKKKKKKEKRRKKGNKGQEKRKKEKGDFSSFSELYSRVSSVQLLNRE